MKTWTDYSCQNEQNDSINLKLDLAMAAIEKWKPTGKMSLLTLAGFQNNCLRVRDPIVKWDFSITTTPRVSRFSNAFYKDSIIFIAPSGHSAHNGLERSLGSLVVLFNRKSLHPGFFKREKRQLKMSGILSFHDDRRLTIRAHLFVRC